MIQNEFRKVCRGVQYSHPLFSKSIFLNVFTIQSMTRRHSFGWFPGISFWGLKIVAPRSLYHSIGEKREMFSFPLGYLCTSRLVTYGTIEAFVYSLWKPLSRDSSDLLSATLLSLALVRIDHFPKWFLLCRNLRIPGVKWTYVIPVETSSHCYKNRSHLS